MQQSRMKHAVGYMPFCMPNSLLHFVSAPHVEWSIEIRCTPRDNDENCFFLCSSGLTPAATVSSGDTITVEMVSAVWPVAVVTRLWLACSHLRSCSLAACMQPLACLKAQNFKPLAGSRLPGSASNSCSKLSCICLHKLQPASASPDKALHACLSLQVTHHAGDDYDKMIRGDPGLEDIYEWGPEGQNVRTRGRTGSGDGVHVLTGPIYVCGAEQGDVLKVRHQALHPFSCEHVLACRML